MSGMSVTRLALLMAVMAGVTYLMRILPFTLLRRPVRSAFLRSLLAYIPYGVLSAMAFPAILYSTGSVPTALAGTAAALILAFFRRSLLVVALGACAAALAAAGIMALL
jgi:branched-subunit amino acid transport protein